MHILIWEREGSPEGREVEHWLQAEREIANGEDAAGLKAGREYDDGVKEFERSGRVERAAEEARKALDGKEKDACSGQRKLDAGPAKARTRVTSGDRPVTAFPLRPLSSPKSE